ncbi:MAG: thiamine-phosphate kinase [Candidatus Nezhaarchaeales archaeon]|nr:MAG: thiamine-phosphate kinase [Candidatus Nezhaarchaeota archaeon WYZ-LMO8]TDA37189.1 MAG: thiamine-phosphate kinase [Candidatus Nezhaarchaeota archaeon WYZ-LMO7]
MHPLIKAEDELVKVKDVGEWRIIDRIWRTLIRDPEEIMGFNDDVVSKRLRKGWVLVAHTDALTEIADILPGMTPHSIGFKSVVMNVSDFASKGVKPLGMLFALGMPGDVDVSFVDEIARGWRDAAKKYGLYVWGGDITEARELVLCGTIIGLAREGDLVARKGAREGDLVACIGEFGLTSIAYFMLLEGLRAPNERVERRAKEAVYYPKAYLKEGLKLARLKVVTSSMDCSDGLAWTLHTLCYLNNVGMVIKNIPIPSEVFEYAKEHGLDPYELALYGGEEYALVFTLKRDSLNRIPKSLLREIHIIGEVTLDKRVRLEIEGVKREVEARGWEHFKSRK